MRLSWDLEAEAYRIAIDRVIMAGPSLLLTAGNGAEAERFVFRARLERCRLYAAVARGERDYMV